MSNEAAQPAVTFQINAQYIRDFSFEAPNTPAIFAALAEKQPDVNVSVNLEARPVGGPLHEVMLRVALEAKTQDKVAFILDLTYCGVFTVQVPEDSLQPLLMIEAPRLLFPFARAIISDAVRDGGFPPILLQPIDFVGLYRNRLEQLAAEQQKGPST